MTVAAETGQGVYGFNGKTRVGNAALQELSQSISTPSHIISDKACYLKVAFYRKDSHGQRMEQEQKQRRNATQNPIFNPIYNPIWNPINNGARNDTHLDWKRTRAQLDAAEGVEVPSHVSLRMRVQEVIATAEFQQLLGIDGVVIKVFVCSHDGERNENACWCVVNR